MEQIAWGGSRCPVSGNTKGQIGWCSEQPGLTEDPPAYCKGVGLDGL